MNKRGYVTVRCHDGPPVPPHLLTIHRIINVVYSAEGQTSTHCSILCKYGAFFGVFMRCETICITLHGYSLTEKQPQRNETKKHGQLLGRCSGKLFWIHAVITSHAHCCFQGENYVTACPLKC